MKTLLVAAAVAAIALTSAAQAADSTIQNSQSTTVQNDANGNPVAAKTEKSSRTVSHTNLNNINSQAGSAASAQPQANGAIQVPAASSTTTTSTSSSTQQKSQQ